MLPRRRLLSYDGFNMETADRFGVPYIAVIGNDSAMNQIRFGQLAIYGERRGNVGNLLGMCRSAGSQRCLAATVKRCATGADRTRPAECARIGAPPGPLGSHQ